MYDPFDVLQSRREYAYRERIAEMSCFDCANCAEPDEPFKWKIGWCLMLDGFVYPHDNPRDAECGCFE